MYLTKRLRIYNLSTDKYLVCNALTGELSIVGRAVYRQMDALRDGRVKECSADVIGALEERKLAFRSTGAEDAAFRSIIEQALSDYLQRARTEYCFAINTHCNFNCVYCFEPEAIRASAATLGEQQLDAAFRIIDEAQEARPDRQPPPEFTLYGGEPLLRPAKPIVVSLIRRVAARGHRANIITNGHTLASFFDVFDAYHEAIESVQITLDGTETDHNQRRVLRSGAGTFARIVANIDAFLSRDYRTRCVIRTSFDRANLHRVSALKQLLDEHGWSKHPRVSVFPVTIQDHRDCGSMEGLVDYCDLLDELLPYSTDSGGGPFDLSSIHVLGHVRSFLGRMANGGAPTAFSPRATFCGAATRLLVFHPDGNIYPCYEVCGQPSVKIGRYYPDYSVDRDMQQQWAGVRVLRQPECFECEISTFCGGGCASGALAKKGTINAAFCEGAHEVFDRYFKIIAHEYRIRARSEA
ncbi:MAG: radical SAM protein [Acidobacteriota bacterium]